jgi:large subunit ribosomal protein L18
MVNRPDTRKARQARHKRVRAKISGTADCPRLNVFRSLQNTYAQLIDDVKGETLVSASTVEKGFENYGGNISAARKVGELLAQRAAEKKITQCVFDRGGYIYHGRVRELAEGAREGGLKF